MSLFGKDTIVMGSGEQFLAFALKRGEDGRDSFPFPGPPGSCALDCLEGVQKMQVIARCNDSTDKELSENFTLSFIQPARSEITHGRAGEQIEQRLDLLTP